jgi:phosphate transport system protein
MAEPRFDERMQHDLVALRRRLRGMADQVLQSMDDAVAAVAAKDRRLAYQVVIQDNRIDVLERQIDRLCQEFLVRHMPVAGQLRFILAVSKVNSELERIGDYAEAIARRAVTLSAQTEFPERERILEMAKLSTQMLRQAIQAFLDKDAELAAATFGVDRDVDQMNRAIFEALAHPAPGESDFTVRFALVGLVNRIERVADRACNIAEETIYAIKGEVVKHLPRSDIRVLFLCEQNGCRSQIAEAIARHTAPGHFVFQSAGTHPGTLDPKAVAFMARKGMDISRYRPKAIGDVGKVSDFNVVVTLSHRAEDLCPQVPYGAIELNWEIADPSKATGSDQEIEDEYDRVFRDLQGKIGELVEGLLGAHAEREEDE